SYPYINPVLKTLYNSEDLMERKTGIKFLSMIDPAYIKEQFKVLKNLTEPPLSEIVLASLPYVCPKEKWSYLEKMLKKDLSGSELLSMVGSLSRIGGDRPLQILKKLEISRNIKNEKLMIQNAILARKKTTRINCQ
ncbi:MAG: hypothetical protein VX642_08340, partial [Bdellovibrionota bacterium]|nr:hypothetical protein [Bdellovibrionota bacterium]